MRLIAWALVLAGAAGALSASVRQEAAGAPAVDDPEIRAVVETFFAAQVAEDADAYFALWSRTAQKPGAEQLKFIFDSGDDLFTDIAVTRVTAAGGRIRVRVSAVRERTDTRNRAADGTPRRYRTRLLLGLAYVREDGTLKLVSEGSPSEELAAAVIAAPTAGERAALLDAEPDLVDGMLVHSVSRRADLAAQAGDFAAARAAYDRVIEIAVRTGDRKAQGQALQNIANAAYFQRDFPAALDAYRARLALSREMADDEGSASALVGIGTVQYSRFEYGDALVTYREAAAIQERLGDGNALGTTLISTGNVLFLQGDFEGAIADYGRSRDLLHKAFNLGNEARALEGLGRTYTAQGDYAAALDALAGVLVEGRARNNRSMLGNAMRSIGDVHFRLGNLDASRAAFDEGRGQFEAARDTAMVGRLWQAIALTELVATRFAEAEQACGKSMAACEKAGDRECAARAIVALAFAQSSQEHFDQAIVTYRKAIDAFGALQKVVEAARAEVGLSLAYLGRKDHEAAAASATRARDAASAAGADDVVWRAATAQARAWRRLGAADKAMAASLDAVGIVQRLVQAAAENPSEHVSTDASSAYALLAVLHAEAGDAGAALMALEQRRARDLRAMIANNERDIWRGMTQVERDEERTLSAALVSVSAQLEQEKLLPRPDAARIERLKVRLAEAAAARAAQQQRLFLRLPDLRTWRGLAQVPPLPDLLARIPAGTTVIEWAVDDDDVVAVTAASGEEAVELHADVQAARRQALAEKVAAVTPAVLRDVREWRRAAGEIVALLPAAALARLASAPSIVVSPDDMLWRVPFEALPAGGSWLGVTTTVRYEASLATIQVAAAPPSAEAETTLLAIAAPELATERVERVRSTAPGWTPRAADVAASEARRVAAIFEGSPALGAQATESALRAQAASATWLHIAAPFRISGASPLFSRVYLSDSTADGADDGMLEAREVFNIEARGRAVVLSDGAAAAMRGAAPAWPLQQWAWRAAGVPAVVMARWPLEGPEVETLMAEFYARMKAGDAPHVALEAAQAKVQRHPDTRAPYFWAGWIVIGK
jgi:CHAT domain-containing protein